MERTEPRTRQNILRAALGIFADRGYSAASVQAIVNAARVTKPTLYYYFENKAALFQALIDRAYDERYRLMREAVAPGDPLSRQLVEILGALFEFTTRHRSLMRIAFATAFAAPGEIPQEISYLAKGERNFEFVRSLIEEAIGSGALVSRFSSQELAHGLYGLMTIRVMSHLVKPDTALSRRDAESIVALFLEGAGRLRKSPRAPSREARRETRSTQRT